MNKQQDFDLQANTEHVAAKRNLLNSNKKAGFHNIC